MMYGSITVDSSNEGFQKISSKQTSVYKRFSGNILHIEQGKNHGGKYFAFTDITCSPLTSLSCSTR